MAKVIAFFKAIEIVHGKARGRNQDLAGRLVIRWQDSVVYQRRAYSAYFRTLYRHAWLCRLMSRFSQMQAEYLFWL